MKHSTAIIALTVNLLLGPLLAHGTALYLKDPEAIGKIVDAHTQGNSDDGSYYTKYGAIYESSGYYHLFYYGSGPEHFIMGELPLLPWVNDELLTDQINYTFLEKPGTVVDRWSEAHFNKAHPWFTSEVLLPAYQDGSGNWNVQQATADSSLVRLGDYFYLFYESWSELDANDEPSPRTSQYMLLGATRHSSASRMHSIQTSGQTKIGKFGVSTTLRSVGTQQTTI